MTSFAGDNRNILKSANRQYNMNVDYASGSNLGRNIEKLRKAVEAKNNRKATKNYNKARKNKIIIEQTLSKGPKKVENDFHDYKVSGSSTFPVALISMAAVITLIAVFFLLNCAQITKYNNEITSLEAQITEYKAQRAELVIQLDKKIDLSEIESYAKESGMVKTEKLPVMYINMTNDYKIEKVTEPETEYAVSTVMSGVAELFREVLN